MACVAVDEHYLENPAKGGQGRLVPGLVGSIENDQANVVFRWFAKLLVGPIWSNMEKNYNLPGMTM